MLARLLRNALLRNRSLLDGKERSFLVPSSMASCYLAWELAFSSSLLSDLLHWSVGRSLKNRDNQAY
jgi:hypothetical protein